MKDFLIFALNKESGCNPDSPCETSNSRMPSLSISATAAPVPNPKGSSPLPSWICFNSPSLKILKSLLGSPILFTKISSKPSLSKSAEIIVLTLDGILNSELATSLNLFLLFKKILCSPFQLPLTISNLPLYKKSVSVVPRPFSNVSSTPRLSATSLNVPF